MAKQKVDIELNDKELRSTILSLAGQLSAAFKDAIEESFDPERFRFVTKDIIASAKESAKLSSKLLENQESLLEGTIDRKKIEDQIKKAKTGQLATEAAINKVLQSGVKFSNENLSALEQIKEEQKAILQALEMQSQEASAINKKTGLLGVALRGISKIPIAGEFFKAEEGIKAMNAAAAQGSNVFSIFGQGLKASLSGFLDLALVKAGGVLVERTKILDQNTANLAKNLNITYQNSNKFVGSLVDAAKASGEVSARADTYAKTILEINQALGTSSRLDLERIASYTKLREVAGFEAETLNDINEASLLNKETLEDILANRLGQIRSFKIQNGLAINEREVLKDISKVSSNIKINFLGNDKALAAAAARARGMGIELNKVNDIASSLLDFESSIKAQFEAQVLTGKELNLDRERYYALTNQTDKLLESLNKKGLSAAEFSKMDAISRESYAQALGMSSEEMSKMLLQQQAIKNLGAADLASAKEKFNQLVKTKGVTEATRQLGSEALAEQFQQQSNQDRLVLATEKLKTSFDDVAISLNKVLDRVNGFISGLSSAASVLSGILSLVGAIAAVRLFKGLGGGLGGGTSASLINARKSGLSDKQIAAGFGGKEAKMALQGGKGLGGISNFLKGGGGIGSLLGGAALGYGAGMAADSGNMGLSKLLSAGSGAIAGASYGSLLGPVGTIAGGLIGGTIGLMAGPGAPELAEGGLVTKGGFAKVDSGEVYLGKNSIQVLTEMVGELKKQTQAIMQDKSIQLKVDGAPLATAVSRNSSNNFAASNLGPRPLDYTV